MASRISINKLCRKCMAEIEDQNTQCPVCGFDRNSYQVDKTKLRLDFILKGQYMVGVCVNVTMYEVTYAGWNLAYGGRVIIKELFPQKMVYREDHTNGTVIPYEDGNYRNFDKVIDKYISSAKTAAAMRESAHIIEFFKENGTAYCIMDCADDKDFLLSKTYTFIDAYALDKAGLTGNKDGTSRSSSFVQPARSVNRGIQDNSGVVPARGSARETQTAKPAGAAQGHAGRITSSNMFVAASNIAGGQRPQERVLPRLEESNREAIEREKQREREKAINKNDGVFTFNPNPGKTAAEEEREENRTRSIVISDREIAESINGKNTAVMGSATITGSGPKTADDSAKSVSDRVNSVKRTSDPMRNNSIPPHMPPGYYDRKSNLPSIIICIIIAILVVMALVRKDRLENAEENEAEQSGKPGVDASGDVIEIEDVLLRETIKNAMGIASTENITKASAASIKKMDLQNQGITDISVLKYFTGLEELNLSNNSLSSIEVLSQLTKLKKLNLSNCKLKDVTALSTLDNLEYLDLTSNKKLSEEQLDRLSRIKIVAGRKCRFNLTFIYHRDKGNYKGYSLWTWNNSTDSGSEHEFEIADDKTGRTVVEADTYSLAEGFKLKYNDWEEHMEVANDREIPFIQNLAEENIEIHIYQDKKNVDIIYGDGTKGKAVIKEVKEKSS